MSAQIEMEIHEGPTKELVERLQRLAVELLERAGAHGCGFDDVRIAAETRGWLTGEENGRFLSFGSILMKKAGGVPLRTRRSKHKQSQRRRITVFVLPQFMRLDAQFRPVPPVGGFREDVVD
jgi:hypothetical protein